MENSLSGSNRKFELAEEGNNKLEDRSFEVI